MFQILIVDDERIILNGCSFMIKELLDLSFPVEVSLANNVPEAMSFLEKNTPDLILTDIRMPVMDGFELIEYIRSQGLSSQIVILTSHADFEYARRALRYNVSDFILKPIDEESLKKVILHSYEVRKKELDEARESYYLKTHTMLLYDVSASDLLLTDDILEELFPYTYFTVITASLEAPQADTLQVEVLLKLYYKQCRCFYLHERQQLICICNHDTFFVKPSNLQDKLYQILGCQFLLGISISSNSIHKIHHLYTNSCQRIFYKKAFGSNEGLTGTACFSYQDCIQIFTKNDTESMRYALLNYMHKLRLVDEPSDSYLEQIYISFFQNIILYLENMGISEDFSHLTAPPCSIGSEAGLAEQIILQILQLKSRIKENYSDNGNEMLTNQLLAFIKEHYREDISLDDLSDAVGLHPNYVCTYFKKATGQSYLTCLHKERILAAKKMLKETDYSIEEIARQVGYNSSTQFGRIFRKYESLSPSDYRNQ